MDSAYASGDVAGAVAASWSARTWNIVGIVFGCVMVAVAIISNVILIPILVKASENSDDYNDY